MYMYFPPATCVNTHTVWHMCIKNNESFGVRSFSLTYVDNSSSSCGTYIRSPLVYVTHELDELSTNYVKLKDLTPKLSLFLMHICHTVCVLTQVAGGKYMYMYGHICHETALMGSCVYVCVFAVYYNTTSFCVCVN